MSFNIPDKIYKLLILVGALLIGFGFYKLDITEKDYFSEIEKYRTLGDSISINTIKLEKRKSDLIKISNNLSITYEVENQISSNDSTLYFNRMLIGDKNTLIVSDSLQKLWVSYINSNFEFKLLDKKLSITDEHLEEKQKLKKSYFDNFEKILNLGYFFFFIGIILWAIDSENDTSKKIKQHEKIFNHCQSCAKNFSSMRNYGKNLDGSLNFAFCSECYYNGKFIEPNLQKEEARERFMDSIKNKNWIKKNLAKIIFENSERWI